MTKLLVATIIVAIVAYVTAQVPVPTDITKLKGYNVNLHDTSVSGLSSGGFFAVQMHMAFSDIMRGAAIFAGGPFHCAEGSMSTATGPCMKGNGLNLNKYIAATTADIASGAIVDPAKYLTPTNQSVYLFSGTKDVTVVPVVMKTLNAYYQHYMKAENVIFENTLVAAHTQPTDDAHNSNPCWLSASPYLSNCNFDGAGKGLQTIYGKLTPRNDGALTGKMYRFDQVEFIKTPKLNSMDTSGYVYVPAKCDAGQQCVLHIAFHGCVQFFGKVGDAYINHAGYNKWADTNGIILLYPQATSSSLSPLNPNGCWDWWGYCGNPTTYDTQKGSQMAAIRDMISRISSGYRPLPAPTGLTVTGVTDNTVSLSWSSSDKAAGYDIKQDDFKINPSLISVTNYTVTGLQSGSTYSFTVNSEDSTGASSGDSVEVIAHTSGPAPPLTPPKDLTVHQTYATSVVLTWTAVSGATGYNVYRNTSRVTSSPASGTTFTDTGLTAETAYSYTASAVGPSGESGQSAPVTATTKPAFNCTSHTDSNFGHVSANRAHQTAGFVFANGSDQGMGLYNIFTMNTLSETKSGYFIIGVCPPSS